MTHPCTCKVCEEAKAKEIDDATTEQFNRDSEMCRKTVMQDRKWFMTAVANEKTDNPDYNAALDRVIYLVECTIK